MTRRLDSSDASSNDTVNDAVRVLIGALATTALEAMVSALEGDEQLRARLLEALSTSRAPAKPVPERAEEELLSTTAAAELVGVKPATIRTWVQSGKLRGLHAGRVLRVSRAELLRFLQPQNSDAVPDPDEQAVAILAKRRRKT